MVVRTGHGPTGESSEDLLSWLRGLQGGPPVHQSVLLSCPHHEDEAPTWYYVEADAAHGVARRRCLAGAHAVGMLDSDERWTHPPMFSCVGCSQSIVEVGVGISVPDGDNVEWLAVGVRCVECGRLSGVTDLVVDGQPLDQVLAGL